MTTAVIGVLQTLGILLDSLLILGDVPTGLAWLGVATGAIGVVVEVLPPVFGWAYVLCGVLLLVWPRAAADGRGARAATGPIAARRS